MMAGALVEEQRLWCIKVVSHLGLCWRQKKEAIYVTKEVLVQKWISNCVTACSDIKLHEFIIESCERSYNLVNRVHVSRTELTSCHKWAKPLTSFLVAAHGAASEYDEVSRNFANGGACASQTFI